MARKSKEERIFLRKIQEMSNFELFDYLVTDEAVKLAKGHQRMIVNQIEKCWDVPPGYCSLANIWGALEENGLYLVADYIWSVMYHEYESVKKLVFVDRQIKLTNARYFLTVSKLIDWLYEPKSYAPLTTVNEFLFLYEKVWMHKIMALDSTYGSRERVLRKLEKYSVILAKTLHPSYIKDLLLKSVIGSNMETKLLKIYRDSDRAEAEKKVQR